MAVGPLTQLASGMRSSTCYLWFISSRRLKPRAGVRGAGSAALGWRGRWGVGGWFLEHFLFLEPLQRRREGQG